MRAIRVNSPGGPDALRVEEIPEPAPGPGEALVRVEAAGVNFIEVYQRSGLYSLSLGWVVTQVVSITAAWRRVLTVHRYALPAQWPSLAFGAAAAITPVGRISHS